MKQPQRNKPQNNKRINKNKIKLKKNTRKNRKIKSNFKLNIYRIALDCAFKGDTPKLDKKFIESLKVLDF